MRGFTSGKLGSRAGSGIGMACWEVVEDGSFIPGAGGRDLLEARSSRNPKPLYVVELEPNFQRTSCAVIRVRSK
jgi:hypothetical protein